MPNLQNYLVFFDKKSRRNIAAYIFVFLNPNIM